MKGKVARAYDSQVVIFQGKIHCRYVFCENMLEEQKSKMTQVRNSLHIDPVNLYFIVIHAKMIASYAADKNDLAQF